MHRDEQKPIQQRRRGQQQRLKREFRRSKRRIERIRSMYKFILFWLIIALCLYILKMPQWRLKANAFDSFKNPSLEIVNNKIVPNHKILSVIRMNEVPRQPIFLVKTDAIKESIETLAPVQNVFIRRFWHPARLQIIIIERTPAILLASDINKPPIGFFSLDGKLIGNEYMPLKEDVKAVKVIVSAKGEDYRTWDARKIGMFKKIATLVEAESGEKVEYIDYRNPKDIYIKIPSVTLRFNTLSTITPDRIQRIPSLLPQIKMLNKKVKYIDLRWDESYIKLDE